MSLSIVASQLKSWGDSAALKGGRLNDPDSIGAMEAAADQFKRLASIVQEAIDSELARRSVAERGNARPVEAGHRGHGGRAVMSAFQFWAAHGRAVQAIIADFGLNWKVKAPIGATVLAGVPACWRSGKTYRGGIVRWSRDHRMPAARYWPAGALPAGLAISDDYAREWSGYGPPQPLLRDAAWHLARGYAWDGSEWRFEIEVRNQQNREDAIASSRDYAIHNRNARESAALNYGPQPLAEVEPQLMAAD